MENQTTNNWSNHPINPDAGKKWYNVDWKLALAILCWPLLVYGIYKTDLMTKRTKQIILYVVLGLFLISVVMEPKA